MTTIAQFITNVAAVSVTGVRRQYVYPPQALNSADLPASYVTPPEGGRGGLYFSFSNDTDKVRRCNLIICTSPVAQNTIAAAFSQMVDIADAVEDALDTYSPPWGISVDYSIDTGTVDVGGVSYWAVITLITAQGDV